MKLKTHVKVRDIEVYWTDRKASRYRDMAVWAGDPSGEKPLLVLQDREHRVEIPLEDILQTIAEAIEPETEERRG